MKETEVILSYHGTTVLTDTAYLKCSPDRVTTEQLIVRRNTGKLHHTEFHHQMVYEFLSILFSKRTLLEVTLNIDIKECRYTTYRHGSTILCLDSCEIAKIKPLDSFAGIRGGIGNIKAITSRHRL